MTLTIFKRGDLYQVAVSTPETERSWRSSQPLTSIEVFEKSARLGCHSTDISDAFCAADPFWARKHDAEVLRRRAGQEPTE